MSDLDPSKFFMPYQIAWINDQSKYAICEKARRIGITFAESFRACKTRIDHIVNGTPHSYFYIAQKADVSKRFIQDCTKFAKLFNEIARATGNKEPFLLDQATQEVIPVIDGSCIKAFSSNPDGLRSFGGDLTIDEAAFIEDGDGLEKAAYPVVSTIGLDCKLRIISTHNGNGTFFNRTLADVVAGKKTGWSHHKYDIYDAVKQGLALRSYGPHLNFMPDVQKVNETWLKNEMTNYSDIAWQQEFECKPVSSGLTLVSNEEYLKLSISEKTDEELSYDKKYNNLYVGYDPGINDLSVVWIIEEMINHDVTDQLLKREFFTRHVFVWRKVRTQEQQDMLVKIIGHPNVVMAYMDQGAFGLTIYEYLMKTTGKVKGISFSAPQKKILAEQVRKYVSQERVSMPKGRSDIQEDVCCVQVMPTESGNITYGGRSSQGHGDAFWALSLALQAAEDCPGSFTKGFVRH